MEHPFSYFLPSTPRSSKWSLYIRSPDQALCAPLLSPIHATCPARLIYLDLITRIIFGDECKSWNSSICSLLHSPITSSLVDLFSNTLSLCSSLSLSTQVSHPHTTRGKITVLYVWIFIYLDSKLEDKRCTPNDSKLSLISICSLFLPEYNFELLLLFPNMWTVPPLQRIYYLSPTGVTLMTTWLKEMYLCCLV
jgi:hypothetical protein